MRAREGRGFDNVVGLWCEVAVEYHPVFVDELAEVQVLGVGWVARLRWTTAAIGIADRLIAVHARIFGSVTALLPPSTNLPIILGAAAVGALWRSLRNGR